MTEQKKNISKQYYQIPELELQDLIARAKDKENEAQLKLLEIFHPYFNKYLMLLYYGRYDLGFYDIRRFVGLFVPDKNLNYFLIRNKLNRDGISKVNDVVNGLVMMINRYSTEQELLQTIHMTFLACLDVYQPSYRDVEGRSFNINGKEKKTFSVGITSNETGELIINPYTGKPFKKEDGILVPFSGFIYNYFFFLLSRYIKTFHIDQLGRRTFPLFDSSVDEDGEENSFTHEPADPQETEQALSADIIDEFWVLGETASHPFDKLSIKERQILKWKYVDGLKAAEIKKRITEHPNTTRESINKIKATLVEELKEDY